MENEPLPSEILEVILSEWWLKEPIRYFNLYRIIVIDFICFIIKGKNVVQHIFKNFSLLHSYKIVILN